MRIAVVGSGISGLVAARALHGRHEVTVFEAAEWIGGHTHTVLVPLGERVFPVDMGFIVFNEATYPGFIALLDELEVPSQPSDMSFGVSCERTGIEYGTASLDTILSWRRNLLRPSFLAIWNDLRRFQRDMRALLAREDAKPTLGELLEGRGYSRAFRELHLVPMASAIWSARPSRIYHFPALTMARFYANHGLLSLRDRPRWRVVQGGSRSYVEALVAPFRERIRIGCPVRAVARREDGVELRVDGGRARFDEVVLALHSDQALALLEDPSDAELRVLGAIRYQENEVVLHTDASLLPRRRRAWSSWNALVTREEPERAVLTYHMNRLQGLDAPEQLCVTLNATPRIDRDRILESWRTSHPIYDRAAVEAQAHWGAISGRRHTHYCGAYWGYGFHEDGVRSGRRVAESLGA